MSKADVRDGVDLGIHAGAVVLFFLVLVALGQRVCADDEGAYVEGWAIRGQSFTRNYPDVSSAVYEQRGYWGGEVLGRIPRGRLALVGRFSTEGAAGGHVFRDPGTWTRAVLEGALSYHVAELAGRYTCGVMGGYGSSRALQRGRTMPHLDDGDNKLEGAPPRYGAGLHCRDSTLGVWVNVRGEFDDAVGPGLHPAVTLHLPLGGDRAAVGLDAVWGEHAKVQLQIKARLFRWGGR